MTNKCQCTDSYVCHTCYLKQWIPGFIKRFKQSDFLTERENTILILHYFHNKCTLKEIGDFFGITAARIRQIKAQALNKLKAAHNV